MAYKQKINSRDNTPGIFRKDQEERYTKVSTEGSVSKFVSDTGKIVYAKKQFDPKKGERYTKLKDSKGNIYKNK